MGVDVYFWLKLAHVLSSTLLFGTGLGIAFFHFTTHRSGDVRAIAVVARRVVWADWLFTTPAVILQPVTGFALLWRLGLPWDLPWILASLVLYGIAGACWLPVVWIQIRVRDLAEQAVATGSALPPQYHALMRWWFWLGWPAFTAVVAIYFLMIMKPAW